MELHIFDASNYIHAGHYSKKSIARGIREDNGEYCENSAPIGGVRFLIRQVSSFINPNNNVMVVFDRPPVIKRKMYGDTFGNYEGYKGNRPKKQVGIREQAEYAETILRDVGICVQSVDEYESDDIIYSLVKYLKDEYEHIYIHTKDSDLYFLVDTNVSIAKVGEQGKDINMYNYNVMVEKGDDILFNTVHLRKMCRGDSSDNIPGTGWDIANALDAIIKKSDYAKLGDLDLSREYLKQAINENPNIPGAHNILNVFNIICPLLVSDEELDFYDTDIDMDKLRYYLHDWNAKEDKWGLEDMLSEYIDSYYK